MNKIAYYCSTNSWGGLEMNQLKNACWMSQRGHSVVILCVKNSPLHLNAIAHNIPVQFIEKQERYYDFKRAKVVVNLIKEIGITHFVIRHTRDMSMAATVKWKLKKQIFIAYFMEIQMVVNKRSFLHSIRFRYFDLWSCPLHTLALQVYNNSKISRSKIVEIPSGVELEHFAQTISRNTARLYFGLPKDTKMIGVIGRFDENKGQLLVLEAFSKLTDKSITLCLMGEPTIGESLDYYTEMCSFIERNQLTDRVYILPFSKDVVYFYKAMDVVIMSSVAETVGMVTLESLASGTPVIGSNSGGTPEILMNGALGALFIANDVMSLHAQLYQFFEYNPTLTNNQLMEGIQKFSHHKVCEQVEKVLKL